MCDGAGWGGITSPHAESLVIIRHRNIRNLGVKTAAKRRKKIDIFPVAKHFNVFQSTW